MNWIRKKALAGEVLAGIWVSSGSPVVAEIAGNSGADWILLDWEHGLGGESDLIHSLQAVRGTRAAPIVRVPAPEPYLIKQALDRGASGIMAPWINTAGQARNVVTAMRYAPQGIRGLAGITPATRYGAETGDYLTNANERLLTIAQIETPEAVGNAEEIAAVEGIDVLFIGPSDLTFSMGIHRQTEHPAFREAIGQVMRVCRRHGKAAGILAATPEMAARSLDDGFTFVGHGNDMVLLTAGMRQSVQVIRKHQKG